MLRVKHEALKPVANSPLISVKLGFHLKRQPIFSELCKQEVIHIYIYMHIYIYTHKT